MITTKQKDEILAILMQADNQGTIDGENIASNLNIDVHEVMKVVDYLERRGLIEKIGMAQYYFQHSFTYEGDDFYKRGGFEYEDTIAHMELNKLISEVESLDTLIPKDKYQRLMQGLGVIISALSLAKH